MGAAHVSITFDIFNFKHLVEIVRYAGNQIWPAGFSWKVVWLVSK